MMPSSEAVAVEHASPQAPASPADLASEVSDEGSDLGVLAGYSEQLDSIQKLELVDALAVLTEHHERLQAALSELDRT